MDNSSQKKAEPKVLSHANLEEFKHNGYLLLKHILDPTECQRFHDEIVGPSLLHYAGIDEKDPNSWVLNSCNENYNVLREMATGDYQRDGDGPDSLPGVMIRKLDGSDPISDRDSMDLSPLDSILNQLHSTDFDASNGVCTDKSWEWLHTNVGWIHVRFPQPHHHTNTNKSPPPDTENHLDVESYSWHIDGGHFTPHFLNSPEQSVVILPMIRPVDVGGGNTLVLKKSHIYMAQQLHDSQNSGGIPREVTQDLSRVARVWPRDLIVEMAPCDAGDVLLLHPFVVHAAGRVRGGEGRLLRIAFNMGVRWKRVPVVEEGCCCRDCEGCRDGEECVENKVGKKLSLMEEGFLWCLTQRVLLEKTD